MTLMTMTHDPPKPSKHVEERVLLPFAAQLLTIASEF
jgi:hypothetical protein